MLLLQVVVALSMASLAQADVVSSSCLVLNVCSKIVDRHGVDTIALGFYALHTQILKPQNPKLECSIFKLL